MKKHLLKLGLIAGVVGFMASTSHAFQSVAKSTVTAGLYTGGSLTADVSVHIRNVTDPFGVDQASITWSGVTPPSTGWKIADQFLLLNATVTDSGGGVQIYTRNMDPDADPKFEDPTPGDSNNADSNPAGLLYDSGLSTSTVALSYAWTIKASSAVVDTDLQPSDPNTGAETGPANRYQWAYGADKNTPSIPSTNTNPFVNGDDAVTTINVVGIHGVQGPAGYFAHPDGANSFLYVQSNFAGAAAQSSYQTTTLTIESFLE